jgi:hypothetical protein
MLSGILVDVGSGRNVGPWAIATFFNFFGLVDNDFDRACPWDNTAIVERDPGGHDDKATGSLEGEVFLHFRFTVTV